ncbi:MAG: response regulator [Myxococcota bacterium]
MRDELRTDSAPPPAPRILGPRRGSPGVLRRRRTEQADASSPIVPDTDAGEASEERIAFGAAPSVLVVEADPDRQWQLARDLTASGARVVGTSSGEGALALLEEWNVDLVLLAAELPGIEGREVCRRILGQSPDMHVALIAHDESLSDGDVERVGAVARLEWPIDLASVSYLLGRARAERFDD